MHQKFLCIFSFTASYFSWECCFFWTFDPAFIPEFVMYVQLNSRAWSLRVLGCQFCPFKSFELMVSCPSYYVAKLGHLRILSLELFLCHNPAICGKSNLLDWLWLILVYFLVISCLVCLGIPPILCCASLKVCEELQLGNRVLKKACCLWHGFRWHQRGQMFQEWRLSEVADSIPIMGTLPGGPIRLLMGMLPTVTGGYPLWISISDTCCCIFHALIFVFCVCFLGASCYSG